LNIELKQLGVCTGFDRTLWGYLDALSWFNLTTAQSNDLFSVTVKMRDLRLAVWIMILGYDTLQFDKLLQIFWKVFLPYIP